jgi:alkylhydroperoxidase family enzyme
VDGTAADASPLERALVGLVRASVETPALLAPRDLEPVRAEAGDDALDYALVVAAFHFINRIADLLGVDPEALPESVRRVEAVRRVGVWVASRLLRRMDLRNRAEAAWDAALAACAPRLGGVPAAALAPLRARPKALELIALALAERDERTTLDRPTLARIHRAVEAALPHDADEARGFHARPADPVEAFAFVGTRYPARTTVIDRLRAAGFDDVGILDLATAVADANQWARLHRLAGLPPSLYYVA